jgi:hypothetical protein
MPRIVKAPLPFAPHNCLVTSRDDGELIDFEADANINEPFPHVVLMRGVVEEAARECCQMVSASEVDALRLQVEGFAEKVAELQADLDAAKAFEDRFGKNLESGVTPGVQVEAATPASLKGLSEEIHADKIRSLTGEED